MLRIKSLIKKFLSREFLTFGIIGVLNTLVHFAIYFAVLYFLPAERLFIHISEAIAFIIASCFSIYMNSRFTFKVKASRERTTAVFIVLICKFIADQLLTWFFISIILWQFGENSFERFAPIIAQIILIPLTFLALRFVFLFKPKKLNKETEVIFLEEGIFD
ncbi:MAG: GtrA family protein [Erysipelotrichales bacterium]|nr:GtrA family protein [Erysipelotrichales bacterium]